MERADVAELVPGDGDCSRCWKSPEMGGVFADAVSALTLYIRIPDCGLPPRQWHNTSGKKSFHDHQPIRHTGIFQVTYTEPETPLGVRMRSAHSFSQPSPRPMQTPHHFCDGSSRQYGHLARWLPNRMDKKGDAYGSHTNIDPSPSTGVQLR